MSEKSSAIGKNLHIDLKSESKPTTKKDLGSEKDMVTLKEIYDENDTLDTKYKDLKLGSHEAQNPINELKNKNIRGQSRGHSRGFENENRKSRSSYSSASRPSSKELMNDKGILSSLKTQSHTSSLPPIRQITGYIDTGFTESNDPSLAPEKFAKYPRLNQVLQAKAKLPMRPEAMENGSK